MVGARDEDEIIARVRHALLPTERNRLRANQQGLIDGRGTERVAEAIVEPAMEDR